MKSILLAILVAVSTTAGLSAGPAQKPFARDEAAKIIANARKTVTPEGIERPGKVAPGTQES
jgi:Ni/Co efflux regulator RcnB